METASIFITTNQAGTEPAIWRWKHVGTGRRRLRPFPKLNRTLRISTETCQITPAKLLSLNKSELRNQKPRSDASVALPLVSPFAGHI